MRLHTPPRRLLPHMQRLSTTLTDAGYELPNRTELLYCQDCKAIHCELDHFGTRLALTFVGVDKKWRRVVVDVRRRDGTGQNFVGRCPVDVIALRKTLHIGCTVAYGMPVQPTVH